MGTKTLGFTAFVLGALVAALLDRQPVAAADPVAPTALAGLAGPYAAPVSGHMTLENGRADATVWRVAERSLPGPRKMNWAGDLTVAPRLARVTPANLALQRALKREVAQASVAGTSAWLCGASGAGQRSACTRRD